MKKVLFVMENLGGGGAERVLVNLVNNMDSTKYEITVMTLFEEGINAKYLNDSVKLINRGCHSFKGIRTVLKLFPKRWLFRHYVQPSDYDVMIAYMTGIPTFVIAASKTPKIAWLHGEFSSFTPNLRNFLKRFRLKGFYNRFDAIAGVSEYVTDSFNKTIGANVKAITVFNTNDCERIHRLASQPCTYPIPKDICIISTVGCLEQTKGYDRLLSACHRLAEENRHFLLWIIGKGIEQSELEEIIEKWQLQDFVKLLGFQENPYMFVNASDFFVCSSRTEGLSTAVSEALILGKPVVSTDVSGAREMLGENSEYGLIVENSDQGIYEGLKALLDSDTREHYRRKAIERAPFFSTERTVKQAQNLIDEVLKKK